jgi:hypothetical protein
MQRNDRSEEVCLLGEVEGNDEIEEHEKDHPDIATYNLSFQSDAKLLYNKNNDECRKFIMNGICNRINLYSYHIKRTPHFLISIAGIFFNSNL